jgi:predicted  nucleic acid-binding Zn-ribbon protein
MISQEYEALLHSALEDQSQHYEGEISCLRATLASSRMQGIQISDRESREIHALQKDSERLKQDSETLSASLLEAQTKEAKLRSMSQRLLREQSISKELLEKIRKETLAEHESARWRMEDLEMQVADLTANLRMMSQLGEEERGGTICGTIGGEDGGKKSGKKSRKGKKKGFG